MIVFDAFRILLGNSALCLSSRILDVYLATSCNTFYLDSNLDFHIFGILCWISLDCVVGGMKISRVSLFVLHLALQGQHVKLSKMKNFRLLNLSLCVQGIIVNFIVLTNFNCKNGEAVERKNNLICNFFVGFSTFQNFRFDIFYSFHWQSQNEIFFALQKAFCRGYLSSCGRQLQLGSGSGLARLPAGVISLSL